MTERIAWVTGAGGEIGHALVPKMEGRGYRLVALDLKPLPALSARGVTTLSFDLLDFAALDTAFEDHPPHAVFHLAALLSGKSENDPFHAHRVNVDGSVALLERCEATARKIGRSIPFFFPSSIAAYGLPDAATKTLEGAIHEDRYDSPRRAYGCHKRYIELFGGYLARRSAREDRPGVDFRALRYPGLISAETTPTGGTSDFAPEMIHAAARGENYTCWVEREARLPFMTMPDAVRATMDFMIAERVDLTRTTYNLRGFAPSAHEWSEAIRLRLPEFKVDWRPDPARQAMIDGWPADVDDLRARADWGLAPEHDLDGALDRYLLPALLAGSETAGPRK